MILHWHLHLYKTNLSASGCVRILYEESSIERRYLESIFDCLVRFPYSQAFNPFYLVVLLHQTAISIYFLVNFLIIMNSYRMMPKMILINKCKLCRDWIQGEFLFSFTYLPLQILVQNSWKIFYCEYVRLICIALLLSIECLSCGRQSR